MQYEQLKPFCRNARQLETVEACIKAGSGNKAAELLGLHQATVNRRINVIHEQAEKQGLIDEHKANGTVPMTHYAETSVMRKRNSQTGEMEVNIDWTKSKLDKSQQVEAYYALIEGLGHDIKPAKPTKAPKTSSSADLVSAVLFGDPHIGMLAHAVETLAEDYDLDKSIADLKAAIDHAIAITPASDEAWFINLGDLTHANDTKNQTQSGNILDVSTRHNQVMRAAGAVIRYCISAMLTKFQRVKVVNARGNHDKDSAFAINMFLEGVYEQETRVEVLGNDSKFNFLEFGKNLIMVNHGDGINDNRLAGAMTRLAGEAWGRTNYHRIWTGHIHHRTKKEHDSGATIETFPILPPVDEWHAGSGYGAERGITVITLHRLYGQVSEYAPSIEMIRAMTA